jgi:hypothetical protein
MDTNSRFFRIRALNQQSLWSGVGLHTRDLLDGDSPSPAKTRRYFHPSAGDSVHAPPEFEIHEIPPIDSAAMKAFKKYSWTVTSGSSVTCSKSVHTLRLNVNYFFPSPVKEAYSRNKSGLFLVWPRTGIIYSFGQVSMYFCLCCAKAFRKSSFPCTLPRSSTAT